MSELFNLTTAFANTSLTQNLADWSVKIMEALGAPGTALLIALESIFPPIPSEVILPLAGFTANQGNLSLIGAIIWTTFGSLAGAVVLYYLGYYLGRDRVRHYANKLPLVKLSDINKAEHWFTKHENQAVFIGRMIPIVRSLISIPAGIEKMPMKLFVIYTVAGSLIWNTMLISAGYLLGEQWHLVEAYVGILQYAVIAVVLVGIVHFVFQRVQKRRKKKTTESE